MKAIVIILGISLVVVSGGITNEQRAKLQVYKESCIGESGVEAIVVENAKNGEIAEGDEKFACFATCMLRKIGIIDAQGEINVEIARAKVPPGVPRDQIDRVFAKCQSIDGNGCEKGKNLMKCIMESKQFSIIQ